MPRLADHGERRRQIAEAVWRIAAEQGLEDVSLRKVADEAGVSMRLIQYYFGTRADLLVGALEMLNADAHREALERVTPDDGDRREVIRRVLMELLPLDDGRRQRHLVYSAYFVRFLHDDDLARAAGHDGESLEDLLTNLLGTRTEAELLVACAQGIQARMLLGQLDQDRAIALLDHQLDRALAADG
jgi:AcrR family transcriptional regulator